MFRELMEFLGTVIVPIFAVTIVFFGVIMGLVGLGMRHECLSKTKIMQLDANWGFFQGCMIRIKTQWLPMSEVVPVEKDGQIVFTAKPHIRLKSEEN